MMARALDIKIGIKKSETKVEAILPKMRATPSPPKIGSVAKSRLPNIMATAVNIMGLDLVAVAMAMALFFSMPLSFISDFVKSMSSSELLAEIPMREMKPIREVAVKKKLVSVK